MRDQAVARFDLEIELRRALESGAFEVHYQPIVSLRDEHAVVGVEALIRWRHPERGALLPDDFLRVAEETGLIVPIGYVVLDEACRQLRRWHDVPGLEHLTVAVNVSGNGLVHEDFPGQLARALDTHHLDPGRLHLEITESVLMADVGRSTLVLDDIGRLGVHVAVDDFGTGYSSLSYLKRFPVDTLKVDRSFVEHLGDDPQSTAIVSAVVSMAHALDMEAIGEGVETEAQADALATLGCDAAQGFHLAPPLSPEDATAFLLERRAPGS
jgi:EAL domain-containing protein (putative c-di-GMP-specific phosphodiesterase class I)